MGYAKLIKNRYYGYTSYDKYMGLIGLKIDFTKEQADKIADEREKRNNMPMPNGKYDIIYADPPWRYDFSKSNSRAIESHYQTMELQDICNLKIPSKEDSVLFLWATAPKIKEALAVMESWGFTYKTNLVWIKDKIGMGYHARGRHELLFIGTRGNGRLPAATEKWESVIYAARGEHSEKPQILYEIIEGAYPNCKYLELFARNNNRKQWETWGNES